MRAIGNKITMTTDSNTIKHTKPTNRLPYRFIFNILILLIISCNSDAQKTPIVKQPVITPQTTKYRVNVFIENSASMNGYVNGVTEFKDAIYGYLSDINNSEIAEHLKLNYINNRIIPQNITLKDFIYNLSPKTLAAGNTGTTDISGIIEQVLEKTKENNISIFISDCIFSPGANNNAEEYLKLQQTDIKNAFTKALRANAELGVIVYRLSSTFHGIYYSSTEQQIPIKAQRPYFIWIIGNKTNIKALQEKVDQSKVKGGGVQNSYSIFMKSKNLNYGILNSPTIGSFERVDKTTIKKAKKDSDRKEFAFSVGVNYSSFFLDETYLMNPDNYHLSDPNYKITIVKANTGAYTHILKLSTKLNIISASNIKIELLNKMPNWIDSFNDNNGKNINANGAISNTFGIKNLLAGLYEACIHDGSQFLESTVHLK